MLSDQKRTTDLKRVKPTNAEATFVQSTRT